MRPELLDLPEPNWFHHGVRILDLLEQHKPMRCVELGSNRGCSAIAVARLIRQWGGYLTCVDQWEDGLYTVGPQVFADNVMAAGVSDTIGMVHATTQDAAATWVGAIDYLYIDADHTREGCRQDLEDWWPFVTVGGLVAGDDYDDPHGFSTHGVTAAWDDFEREHGQAFERTVSPELLGCQCEKCQQGRLIWGIKR